MCFNKLIFSAKQIIGRHFNLVSIQRTEERQKLKWGQSGMRNSKQRETGRHGLQTNKLVTY
jgi:hypothetical protein